MGSTYLIRFHEFSMAADGRNDLLSIEGAASGVGSTFPNGTSGIEYLVLSYCTLTARISGQNVCSHPFSQSSSTNLCIFCIAGRWGNERLRSLHCSMLSNQSIEAFSMTDKNMRFLFETDNEYVATAAAKPVVIYLWTWLE